MICTLPSNGSVVTNSLILDNQRAITPLVRMISGQNFTYITIPVLWSYTQNEIRSIALLVMAEDGKILHI